MERVLVLDMTHGGDIIARRFAAEGCDVTCVDNYRNCPQDRKAALVEDGVRVCEEAPVGSYDLAVLPMHCPRSFMEGCDVGETISFSRAINRFIEDRRFRIEVTGVKGKTSTCYLIAKVLHDSGRSVMLHTSRGEGPWTDDGHRIDRLVSIAPPYLMTLPAGDFDVIVTEVSLGGSGRADIAMITNLVEDYGIARDTFRASDAKREVLCPNVNIVDSEEVGFWSAMCDGVRGYGRRVRMLSEPRLGQPLRVSVDYRGTSEIELDGSYISTEYLRAMDAALEVAEVMDIDRETVLRSLSTFRGVPGRGEIHMEGGRTVVRERNPGISPLSVRRTMECLAEMDCLHDAMVVLDPVSRKVCDKMKGDEIRAIVESYGVPIVITSGEGERPEVPEDMRLLIELIKEGYQ